MRNHVWGNQQPRIASPCPITTIAYGAIKYGQGACLYPIGPVSSEWLRRGPSPIVSPIENGEERSGDWEGPKEHKQGI